MQWKCSGARRCPANIFCRGRIVRCKGEKASSPRPSPPEEEREELNGRCEPRTSLADSLVLGYFLAAPSGREALPAKVLRSPIAPGRGKTGRGSLRRLNRENPGQWCQAARW